MGRGKALRQKLADYRAMGIEGVLALVRHRLFGQHSAFFHAHPELCDRTHGVEQLGRCGKCRVVPGSYGTGERKTAAKSTTWPSVGVEKSGS